MRKIIILIIVILIGLTFYGCKSKKVRLEKSRAKTEYKKKLDSTNFSKVVKQRKTNERVISKETEKEETIEYDGKAGDSLKVIKIGENGKIISQTIYTGVGKATLKSSEKAENKDLKKNESDTKTEDSKVSVKKEDSKKSLEIIKNKDIKKSGFSFMTYVWIFLIITIIIAIWYLNNRFNFISKIKSFLNF